MWLGVVLALIVIAVLIAWAFSPQAKRQRRANRKQRNLSQLRREYARMLQLPPHAASEQVNRVMREMARDYPDRSAEWHLRKLISDLQRDRR